MPDIVNDVLSSKEGRLGQRAPVAGAGVPDSACAPDLFSRFDALPALKPEVSWGPVRYYLGWRPGGPGQFAPDTFVANFKMAFGGKKEDLKWVWWVKEILASLWLGALWVAALAAEVWVTRAGPPGGCKAPGAKALKADIQAKELVGIMTGRSTEWQTKIDYAGLQYFCPTQTLDLGSTVSAYLSWEIDARGLHDYAALNNLCPQAADVMAQSSQARPSPADLQRLKNRGQMPQHEYRMELRRQGWLSDAYVSYFDDAQQWWPDVGTVIDWMRHGTIDNEAVQRWDLDNGFDAALGERPQKWLKGDEVSNENARYLWRSSFRPLDVGTAYDLYRRTQAGMMAGDEAFTDADLAASIQYSDVPPRYRAALFAARWTPLGFRQLKALYNENIIGEDTIVSSLVANGFAPEAAAAMLADWQKGKPAYRRHKIGAGGAAALTKQFAAGTIGTREYLAELRAEGFTSAEAAEALQEARAERQRGHRAELVKYLKARYLKGEVDEVRVQAVLGNSGLDAEDVGDLLRLWRTEFEVHPRQVSASELVSWYKQGLMRESELAQALAQLRYSAADSARIIAAAELGKIAADLKKAEDTYSGAKKRLSADERLWSGELAEAEKLAGKIQQRTRTSAGKLLQWVSKRVVGPVKPVAKKELPADLAGLLEVTNGTEAAAFVDGEAASALEGAAAQNGAANPAAPPAGYPEAPPEMTPPATAQ